MLYTKPIDQITFEDVIAFCAERHREAVSLDYKRQIDASLAKTIAAMANTWGGLIILGVEDDDSRPRLPVGGLDYEEHLRERINNIVLGNITPPVFPEIQICQSEERAKALIVVRIAQSDTTPHAIRENTRVYLRTDTSNEPEELATVDRVLWLVDRRERSLGLKRMFYERAEERWKSLCESVGATDRPGELTLSMSPMYPFETLVSHRRLLQDIPLAITVRGWGSNSFPHYSMINRLTPSKDGAVGLLRREQDGHVTFDELNAYGFVLHREDIVFDQQTEVGGSVTHGIWLFQILTRLDLFLESMGRFCEAIGYWGVVAIAVRIRHDGRAVVINLPPPRNHFRIDDQPQRPVDRNLEFERRMTVAALRENRPAVVASLVSEIGWATGFASITEDTVMVLLRENNRAG